MAKLDEGIGVEIGDGIWPGCTGVEQSTHNPTIEALNPAAGTGSVNKVKR